MEPQSAPIVENVKIQPKVTKMSPSEQKIFQDIAKSIEDLVKLMKESNSNDAKTVNLKVKELTAVDGWGKGSVQSNGELLIDRR